MKTLTKDIIRALKLKRFPEDESLRDPVIRYLLDYGFCNSADEVNSVINKIIFETFADFMETVDSPQEQLYQLRESVQIQQCHKDVFNIYDAMLATMLLAEVCNGDYYINGFDASFEEVSNYDKS